MLQHETVDSGIETNAISWNTYLNALEGSGEWGILLEALRGMQCTSLKPSPTSLTPVVNAVGSLSSWDRAIFMRATSGLYDLILLNSAMCAYGSGHQWKPAQSCLEAMREMRYYDKASLSAAITSCEKASQWRFGLQLVRELSVPDSVGCRDAKWISTLRMMVKSSSCLFGSSRQRLSFSLPKSSLSLFLLSPKRSIVFTALFLRPCLLP